MLTSARWLPPPRIRPIASESDWSRSAALAEQKSKGGASKLHIIIFDELDAICRSRGHTDQSAGLVYDSLVNQLLSIMDGVTPLDNVLLLGMTNRKDLIDDALLRPGRFEVRRPRPRPRWRSDRTPAWMTL